MSLPSPSLTVVTIIVVLAGVSGELSLLNSLFEPSGSRWWPSPVTPWSMVGHDPARSFVAPDARLAIDAQALSLVRSISVAEGHDQVHGWIMLADLVPEPGAEILAGLVQDFGGDGRLVLFSADGRELWGIDFGLGQPGYPLVADFDQDGALDVFANHGIRATLLRANGSLIWSAASPQATPLGVSLPIPFDVNGDGAPDVVQGGAVSTDHEPPFDVLEEKPLVWALDGRTGEILFIHELSCGQHLASLSTMEGADGPVVLTACLFIKIKGVPGSTVEALSFHEFQGRTLPLVPKIFVNQDWSVEVRDGKAHLWSASPGEFDSRDGIEIALVSTHEQRLVITVLATDGSVLYEIMDDARPTDQVIDPVIVDLDGDGDSEIIIVAPGDRVTAYDIGASGLVTLWDEPAWEVEPGHLASPGGLAAVDLDLDGSPEVFSAWSSGGANLTAHYRVHASDGSLLWQWSAPRPAPDAPARDWTFVAARGEAIGDLDGDGTPELLWASYGRIVVFGTGPVDP